MELIHVLIIIIIFLGFAFLHYVLPKIYKKGHKKRAISKFYKYYRKYLSNGTLALGGIFSNIVTLDSEKVKIGKYVFNLNEIQDIKFYIYSYYPYNKNDNSFPRSRAYIYITNNAGEELRCLDICSGISTFISFVLVLKFILMQGTNYDQSDLEKLLCECEKTEK